MGLKASIGRKGVGKGEEGCLVELEVWGSIRGLAASRVVDI